MPHNPVSIIENKANDVKGGSILNFPDDSKLRRIIYHKLQIYSWLKILWYLNLKYKFFSYSKFQYSITSVERWMKFHYMELRKSERLVNWNKTYVSQVQCLAFQSILQRSIYLKIKFDHFSRWLYEKHFHNQTYH